MFDSLKKSLGLSKVRQESKGQRLGTAAEDAQVKAARKQPQVSHGLSDGSYDIFDHLFHESKLGMSIVESQERLPVDYNESGDTTQYSRAKVNHVNPGGEAERLGIISGDYILALNETRLLQFQDFYEIIVALERPVKISFLRFLTSEVVHKVSPPSLVSPATISSIFNFRGNVAGSQTALDSSNDAELEARREERLKAVIDRTQALEKRFKKSNSGSTKSTTVHTNGNRTPKSVNTENLSIPVDPVELSDNIETQRVIERTKAEERRVEQSLGYNPFRPHMSFSGNAATVTTTGISSVSPTPPTQVIPTSSVTAVRQYEEEDEDIIAEVDDSFAMLLSLTDADQERAKVAVQTVQKMLLNLHSNKQDTKFRSIRMNNKAFQSRVASVPGGVELLVAAGYRLEIGDIMDASPTSPPNSAANGTLPISKSDDALNETEARETFLLHGMDSYAERKLNYTVSRLQELLDMQSKV